MLSVSTSVMITGHYRYEFLHNHGHWHWRQTFEAALRCIFSTTGDYWRWMAHQHRRMPLTLCYR
jgi:hypothetical protein